MAGAPVNRFNVVMTAPTLAAPAVALLERAGCLIHYTAPYPQADAVASLVRHVQADAILARQGPLTDSVLAASPRLRIVARHGVGVDNVDLAAAARRGIVVTRTPGANTQAVAEHTLALILALIKDLRPLSALVATGAWRGADTKVRDIAGLRLGLLGYGAIGRAVGGLAQGVGMRVAAFDPSVAEDGFGPVQRAATLPDLASVSDVVSVHCPLLPATRHVVDAAMLAAMPHGGFVVNTARGGIVDEASLGAALDSGHVAGAALDVFEDEPPAGDHRLRNHPRVIATPHVAGVTDASLVAMGVMAAECIVAMLTGGTVPPDRIVGA